VRVAVEKWDDRKLVLGLGNPGADYERTRHNLGRAVVEELARRRSVRLSESDCGSSLTALDDVVLAIPETYMNRSGYAARCLAERRGVDPTHMLVVFDDFALPLGSLRMRPSGGPGGHNGMASVIECLGRDDVPRLRLGISPAHGAPAGEEIVPFVLAPFTDDEEEAANEQIARAADACELWIEAGTEIAMNRFNGPGPSALASVGEEED
jgi:PTH1 family peptidyl-tRNA hydrolase